MTIQDLGSLGGFVAATATVATLVYLSVQIRATNRLARAEASRSRISDLNRLNASFAADPAFRTEFRLGSAGSARDQIDPGERMLLDFSFLSATNIAEHWLWRSVRASFPTVRCTAPPEHQCSRRHSTGAAGLSIGQTRARSLWRTSSAQNDPDSSIEAAS